jgi:hypothetical protein
MSRKFLIPLLTAAFVAAPAFASITAVGPSASAVAGTTVKSTKSNGSYRMGGGGGGGGRGAMQKAGPAQGPAPNPNGITINCAPHSNGDPLEGLNVDKPSSGPKKPLC